jgi:alpha-galactosidase
MLSISLSGLVHADDPPRPVKVFILAGQSNMEGKAKVSLLEYQAQQPATRDLFKHLRRDGKWVERPDVWIKYLGHTGKLTVGYGSPKCIGPELGFGLVVGDHYPEQVLLIKTAWGGPSLYRDFRPPSAGLPVPQVLDRMLADLKKRKPDATLKDVKDTFGASYRSMLQEVNGTLANLKTYFPDYAGQGYEIAGFIWFQGWNDMIHAEYTAEYTKNLIHFIDDVRTDLKAPKLPFVIGEMGIEGLKPGTGIQKFRDAQAAVFPPPRPFRGTAARRGIFRTGLRPPRSGWPRKASKRPWLQLRLDRLRGLPHPPWDRALTPPNRL